MLITFLVLAHSIGNGRLGPVLCILGSLEKQSLCTCLPRVAARLRSGAIFSGWSFSFHPNQSGATLSTFAVVWQRCHKVCQRCAKGLPRVCQRSVCHSGLPMVCQGCSQCVIRLPNVPQGRTRFFMVPKVAQGPLLQGRLCSISWYSALYCTTLHYTVFCIMSYLLYAVILPAMLYEF